jgi:hypothetical protein
MGFTLFLCAASVALVLGARTHHRYKTLEAMRWGVFTTTTSESLNLGATRFSALKPPASAPRSPVSQAPLLGPRNGPPTILPGRRT